MIYIKEVLAEEINRGIKRSLIESFKEIFLEPSKNAVFIYRIALIMKQKGYKLLSHYFNMKLIKSYGIHISLNAKVGLGLQLRHVNGIVIGDGVVIGKNLIIYQQVTLGGQNLGDAEKGDYPTVGDNVVIFSGAKILGKVKIGDNSIIGANSVVVKDVESNSVYAGVPAKKIKTIEV